MAAIVISQVNLREYLNFMSRAAGSKVTDMNGREWTAEQFAARRGYEVTSVTFIPAFTMSCVGGVTKDFTAKSTFTLDATTINEQTTC